jgi:hypothetical protein
MSGSPVILLDQEEETPYYIVYLLGGTAIDS